jgi:hypothetical protein
VVIIVYSPSRSNRSGTNPLHRSAVDIVSTTKSAADISAIRSSNGTGGKSSMISFRDLVFCGRPPKIPPLLLYVSEGNGLIVACNDPKFVIDPFCLHRDNVTFIIRTFPVVAAVCVWIPAAGGGEEISFIFFVRFLLQFHTLKKRKNIIDRK